MDPSAISAGGLPAGAGSSPVFCRNCALPTLTVLHSKLVHMDIQHWPHRMDHGVLKAAPPLEALIQPTVRPSHRRWCPRPWWAECCPKCRTPCCRRGPPPRWDPWCESGIVDKDVVFTLGQDPIPILEAAPHLTALHFVDLLRVEALAEHDGHLHRQLLPPLKWPQVIQDSKQRDILHGIHARDSDPIFSPVSIAAPFEGKPLTSRFPRISQWPIS